MIIEFKNIASEEELESMDRQQLEAYLENLNDQLAALDGKEPKNQTSEAYEEWADAHEELEDLIDEVLDYLDEL